MKNTRWRDIIVSNLIGIAFGVVLISVGFKFIAENVRTSIVTAIILIIVSGILIIIVYRYRKNAIATLTGIKESDIESIKESIEQLDGSIKTKNLNKVQISISKLLNIGLVKYSEAAFRTWAFRTFFSLLAVFGGVITAGLLLKQNQLIEDQKNLLSSQNSLIEKESRYLIEINKPRLGIKNSGVTVREGGFQFESVVKIENYGEREANDLKISTTIYEVINKQCRVIFQENLNPSNPVVPDQVTDYVQHFVVNSVVSTQFMRLKIQFTDNLSEQTKELTFYYRYPLIEQIIENPKGELGLFNTEESELNQIQNCE